MVHKATLHVHITIMVQIYVTVPDYGLFFSKTAAAVIAKFRLDILNQSRELAIV